MVILTESLAPPELAKGVASIIEYVRSMDADQIEVMYGFGCNTDHLYETMIIPVQELQRFLEDSADKQVFHLGDDDLHIKLREPKVEFLLCHESDLHFEVNDVDGINAVRKLWQNLGFQVFDETQPEQATREYRHRMLKEGGQAGADD